METHNRKHQHTSPSSDPAWREAPGSLNTVYTISAELFVLTENITLIRPERLCCLLQHRGHKRYCHPINADWGRDLQTRFQIHQMCTGRCCSSQAISCFSHMQLWQVGAVYIGENRFKISADFEPKCNQMRIQIQRKYKATPSVLKPDMSSQQPGIKCKLLTMTRGKLSNINLAY